MNDIDPAQWPFLLVSGLVVSGISTIVWGSMTLGNDGDWGRPRGILISVLSGILSLLAASLLTKFIY